MCPLQAPPQEESTVTDTVTVTDTDTVTVTDTDSTVTDTVTVADTASTVSCRPHLQRTVLKRLSPAEALASLDHKVGV